MLGEGRGKVAGGGRLPRQNELQEEPRLAGEQVPPLESTKCLKSASRKTGLYKQEDVDIMKNHLNVISKVSDIWSAGQLLIHG